MFVRRRNRSECLFLLVFREIVCFLLILVAVNALCVLVAEIQAACPVVGGGGGPEEEGAALDAAGLRGVPVPTAQGIISCARKEFIGKSAR